MTKKVVSQKKLNHLVATLFMDEPLLHRVLFGSLPGLRQKKGSYESLSEVQWFVWVL